MSEKVQRLSPGVIQTLLGSRGVMEADDHGRFVSFADYATLQARLAACEAERDAANRRSEWLRSVLVGIERIGIDNYGERRYSGDNFATAISKVKLTLDVDTERMAANGYAAIDSAISAGGE